MSSFVIFLRLWTTFNLYFLSVELVLPVLRSSVLIINTYIKSLCISFKTWTLWIFDGQWKTIKITTSLLNMYLHTQGICSIFQSTLLRKKSNAWKFDIGIKTIRIDLVKEQMMSLHLFWIPFPGIILNKLSPYPIVELPEEFITKLLKI